MGFFYLSLKKIKMSQTTDVSQVANAGDSEEEDVEIEEEGTTDSSMSEADEEEGLTSDTFMADVERSLEARPSSSTEDPVSIKLWAAKKVAIHQWAYSFTILLHRLEAAFYKFPEEPSDKGDVLLVKLHNCTQEILQSIEQAKEEEMFEALRLIEQSVREKRVVSSVKRRRLV
jgi:hypothetical protein